MKIILPLLFIILTSPAHAQPNFKNMTFAEALQLAKAKSKMIFLQFESADCDECNEVADKGLSDKELAAKINEAFITLKINTKHPDREDIAMQYNMSPTGFGTLFIDRNGALILKYPQTTSAAREYTKQVDLALYSLSESERINDLEKEYADGNKSPDFIEVLLLKRKALKLPTDNLLDEYVGLLPADSLNSIRTLIFIAQMAPMLDSKAYYILYRDPHLFNKAWYSMENTVRVGINNAIIHKGIQKAIKGKNEAAALRAATFAKNVYGANITGGIKAFNYRMLSFYEKTDTAKYLVKAVEYYNQYYMEVTLDSVKKTDSINRARLYANAEARDSIVNGKKIKVREIAYSPVGQFYGDGLNRAAWNFYKMTNDPELLSIATRWALKALELFKKPGIMDTYARLLYKQGQVQKAIEIETAAREEWKARNFSTKEYDVVLDKMKRRAVLD